MPQVDVSMSTTIECPRHLVASYSGDPDNAPKWYVNIKSVDWKSPRPAVVGSRIAFVAHFLGRRIAYTYEIVESVANERLVMRTADGPFPMETTYHWESVDESTTRMTLRNRGTPAGFSSLAAPLMAFMIRRANKQDLSLLKRLLEQP